MVNINVKKVLEKLLSTRMVIESGTDGIWTYRKWSDGTAECWGKTDPVTYTHTAQSGYGYYTSADFTLPTGLFKTVEVGLADRLQGVGSTPFNTLITINVRVLTTTNFGVYVQSASSGSQSLAISMYVKGTWATFDPSSSTLDITGFSQQQMTKAEIRALIEGSGNIYKDNDTWIPSDLT